MATVLTTRGCPFKCKFCTFSLNPLAAANGNAYRLASPHSTSEYFVVEYRKKAGTFESSLPGSGLLVYRINTAIPQDQFGNDCGPPDEVYLYRPGGSAAANGDLDKAPLGADTGRTAMNDYTNPSSLLSDGSPGGLDIANVRLNGSALQFDVRLAQDTAQAATILSDGFEGGFPGQWLQWSGADASGARWGRSTYRAATGSGSAWCAAGGPSPSPAGTRDRASSCATTLRR